MRFTIGLILLLQLTFVSLSAQHNIAGEFHDYAGSRLVLRSDSTFWLHSNYNTWNTWCAGKWSLKNDTLRLNVMPVYDTTIVHCKRGYADSLLLSADTKAERIPHCKDCFSYRITLQDTEQWPDSFVVKKDQLFAIAPGGILYSPKKEGVWTRIDRSKPPQQKSLSTLVTGSYYDQSGTEIRINPDSTFELYWDGHMISRWAQGTWTTKLDTIYFHPVVVIDTIGLEDVRDLPYDSLFLSEGDSAQRYPNLQAVSGYSDVGGYQSPEMVPYKFWISQDRLYLVLPDGAIDKRKRSDGYPGRSDDRYTYFTRNETH